MSSGGHVVRFPAPPRRDVVRAARVKARPPGKGYWRLVLSCEHTVTLLKVVNDIASALPPEHASCWKCLAYGVPRLTL